MLKTLKKFKTRKDNVCAKPGCSNQVKREKNGTVLNYCSSNCQTNHYAPGSEYDDELWENSTNASGNVTSNRWGVWSPNQNDNPPPYSSIEDDDFEIYENVTPLWETDNVLTSNTSNSSSNPTDDFPIWLGSSIDPLWTPPPKNNNSSRKNSSNLFTPRSSSPSDDEEIQCPACTFYIRPNKTVCEMCGTSITRQEPKRSHKSSSKPKTTVTSYRDLYGEDDDDDDDLNPFADPLPRRNKQSSSSNNYERSSDNYERPSNNYERSSNNYERSSNNYERSSNNYERSSSSNNNGRSSSSSQSYSRNRKLSDFDDSSFFQNPTPPSDQLWIDDDDDPMDFHTPRPRSPEPKPYIYRDNRNVRERSERNVQKPPTPPLNEKDKVITCSACNFNNHSSMTHCEICFTQLNKTPPGQKRITGRFNKVEETRAKKSCSACSYYNDADSIQCEMCYSPIAGAVRKSTFNLPSLFKHDVNMTQCPICTFMNHPSMPQCEMCQNELPGSNVIQQQQQYQQYVENIPGPVTKLLKLPLDDHDYMTVQQTFKVGIPNAKILAMFRMVMPARLIQAHEAYKKQVAGNNLVASVTHRMFHGTQIACDAKRYYGAAGWTFCAANCGLCGIAQNGNSCGKSRYNGRMWFANNSQTSLGYCAANPIKAMFVLDIISATGGPIIIVDKEAATLVKYLILFQA